MHSYSTHESRVGVYGLLAVISVVLAWAILWLSSSSPIPEWLISPPSLAGVYALLYAAFNRWGWRCGAFRQIGLVDIHDVSGEYEGSLVSTYRDENGEPIKRKVHFRIEQTWTQIEVTMTVAGGASSSKSQSAVASVSKRSGGTHLVYVYHNQVNPGIAAPDMSDHEGAADIEISRDGKLTGRYFNSRPNAGTIIAKRVG